MIRNVRRFVSLFAGALLAVAPVASCAADEKEEPVSIDAVPAAVRDAIEKQLGGGKVKEIERETENGKTTYEVEGTKDGKAIEFEVSEDGVVLKDDEGDDDGEAEDDEQTISLDQAPPAVRDAVNKAVGPNTVDKVVKEAEGGRTVYEAKYVANGVEHEIVVSDAGNVLEEVEAVEVAKLPQAVTRAVNGKHAGGKITEAELCKADGKTFYEVEVTVGKKHHELKISQDGKIESDEAHDNDQDDKKENNDQKPDRK